MCVLCRQSFWDVLYAPKRFASVWARGNFATTVRLLLYIVNMNRIVNHSSIMKHQLLVLLYYGVIVTIVCCSTATITAVDAAFATLHVVSSSSSSSRKASTTKSTWRTSSSSSSTTTPLFASRPKTAATNFPFSTRAALIEKAKQINVDKIGSSSSATTSSTVGGTYSARGWSNRLGSVLTPVAIPGVYTADRPFYWNNIDVGCRMTIIELETGGLWIHSPVGLDGPLKAALRDKLIGNVKYVVSPNYEHVKYAKQWNEQYPQAYMWGCPGLMERMPEINWTGEIPSNYVPGQSINNISESDSDDSIWDYVNEIVPYHIDMEVNPFTGKPFFNEVIYYHVPSKTLLTTDLYWNYPSNDGRTNSFLVTKRQEDNDDANEGKEEDTEEELVLDWELAPSVDSIPIGSKLWKFGMDQIYKPFYKNLMIKDRSKYQAMCHTILNEWDIETVIPAHGDILHGKDIIRTVLTKHLL